MYMTLGKLMHQMCWLLLVTITLVGCVKNPVTGSKDFILVSNAWDREVGARQYLPLRQMQGGDYTADPTVEQYVREVGNKLARVSDSKLPYEFNVINSSVPNAWALPSGKISINRGLLTKMNSEAELAAVLGHEIIHAASRHGAQSQSKGMVAQVGVVAATVELESDLYGMEYMKRAGYDLQGAVDLQRTFVKLSAGKQPDFISGLFSSHPPSQARVNANIATAKRLGAGGTVGRERYQRVMQRLRKTEPAYEKFEQAQKAFAKGNLKNAQSLTQQAIRIESRDAHFHSLLGDIAGKRKNWRSAKRHYDSAISLNNELFYYYLQRGKVHQVTKNLRAAKSDFERSLKLLPTEDAQAGLGDVARLSGDEKTAARYFSAASKGRGPAAQYAMTQLAELEFADSPGKFLRLRHGKGKFRNRAKGQQSRISGSVAAGKTRVIKTGTRLTEEQLDGLKVYVVNARLVGR